MAYGDGGGSNLGNKTVTFKGFSSKADKKNFKLYDFEVAKQDLINRLSVRKGERVENPEFGTIIYDTLFEPFTDTLKEAIERFICDVLCVLAISIIQLLKDEFQSTFETRKTCRGVGR